MKKKILSIILSITMLFSITTGLNLTAYAYVDYGTCGNYLTWSFDSDKGELVVKGDGAIPKNLSTAPWENYSRLIKTVIFENGVTNIAGLATCENLTKIVIGDSVSSLSGHIFYSFTKLNEIIISPNNAYYCSEDGVIFNKNKSSIIYYVRGNTRNSYDIPVGIKNIGEYAFYGYNGLESINIPNTVTNIGMRAFSYSYFTDIKIPNSVTNIEESAFYGAHIKTIQLSDNLTKIEKYCFTACTSLINITIPNNVTKICKQAFYDCLNLSIVTLPKSIKFIEEEAFSRCYKLYDVYYLGSESDWAKINISKYSGTLTNAEIHYNNFASTTNNNNEVNKDKKVKSTSIKKLSAGKKQFKLTWKAVSGVTGYQVQYSTDKKFKKGNKTVTVKGAKKTSTTVKKLKSKKTYYVRIRTYKGKQYSAWSKAKSVKIK